MAFIRKRGNAYYLVHCIRKKGRVQQVHLACLGSRPHISDDVIRGVSTRHPFVRIDWNGLREKAATQPLGTAAENAEYWRGLLDEVHRLHHTIAELPLAYLGVTGDRELHNQMITELKLLRNTVDVKLQSSRKGKILPLRQY